MATSSPDVSCVVRHHHAVYRMPREHPAPPTLRHRLDRLARTRLAELAGGTLSALSSGVDESLWLVHRLEVDFTADLGLFSDDAVAAVWAHTFATRLRRVLAAGPDGSNVLRFDDRASYLAAFLSDLTRDRAWDRWYYSEFEGLRVLGRGRAAAEALRRQPDQITTTLVYLEERGQLDSVLRGLHEENARTIYEAIPDVTDGAGLSRRARLEAVVAAWRRTGDLLVHLGRNAAALRLFARVAMDADLSLETKELCRVIDTVLALAEALRTPPSRTAVLDALAREDLSAAALTRTLGGDGLTLASLLPALDARDRAWIAEIVRVLSPSAKTPAPKNRSTGETVVGSAFAGVFLLLPSYLALGIDAAVGGHAELRRQVLALCFGGEWFTAALTDPAFDLAAGGVDGEGAPPAEVTRDDLLHQLLGTGHTAARWISAEIAQLRDERVVLLRDLERDTWLWAEPLPSGDSREALAAAARSVVEASGREIELLLLRGGFAGDPTLDVRELPATRLLRETAQATPESRGERAEFVSASHRDALTMTDLPADAQPVLRRFLARARSAAQELAYLHPVGWEASPPRLSLLLAAHAVLRSLARRLPGFEWSGGNFLHVNFLAGEGTLRITTETLRVTLPSSPLRLVLRMAGVDGSVYTLPWTGGRRIELALPSG